MKNYVVKFPEDRDRLMLLILSSMLMSINTDPIYTFDDNLLFATQESSGFVYSFAGTSKAFVTGALIMVIQNFYPSQR